jgi:hypothetical protein
VGKPLCIDLFCGLGGWTEGFLSEGYECVGFDIERHRYPKTCSICCGTGNIYRNDEDGDFLECDCWDELEQRPGKLWSQYPGQLVLQDVLTLDGRQFRNAAVIVASPPCQEYSRYAMPFGSLWREHNRMDDDGAPAGNYNGKNPVSNHLFRACLRIAREAGVPIVIENVKGAERFVGPAAWKFRSFFLWGDVPALMPKPSTRGGAGSWFFSAKNPDAFCTRKTGRVPEVGDGLKFGGGWWHDSTNNLIRKASSRSAARKAASAQIAKIPFVLAQHIARVFKPR